MRTFSFILAFCIVALAGCGPTSEYKNLCNALYCNPDLEGYTHKEVRAEFGAPDMIRSKNNREIWTYEAEPAWNYGSEGTVKIYLEEGMVTKTVFTPRDLLEQERKEMKQTAPVGTYPSKPTIGK